MTAAFCVILDFEFIRLVHTRVQDQNIPSSSKSYWLRVKKIGPKKFIIGYEFKV